MGVLDQGPKGPKDQKDRCENGPISVGPKASLLPDIFLYIVKRKLSMTT